jgi:hypothetical protein
MRGLIVLLVLIIPQVAWASPRVALSVDSTGQRWVQLRSQGAPAYPTVDVTCDGQRRTIWLTRTEYAGKQTVASYGVPESIAETMLRSAQCRLLIPRQDIRLARRQIQAAWSGSPRSSTAPKKTTAAKGG